MTYINLLKKWILPTVVVALLGWFFFANWSFVFKSKIIGEVVASERVAGPLAIVGSGNQVLNPQIFSFSVAVKDLKTGEIHMASSEDRQWAAVSKGNCVVAAFFPYPPWRMLDKGMTNHNARLLRNFSSCDQVPKEDGFVEKLKFFFLMN
ncbi:MAG: hypothetical protein A2622_10510 [Bdellovibrionales bacterium RIFCSPHIGHO2_01_FULL_40_29]|nr:MAG: hypothetical protein A2622_10510 [Bdellovibrionales bacterium RIFCSPHIGHO2_01_FULL_40_29]OFZ34391.1 MAG: hypothetical protein A3D17_00775 [Bdellovibrionales bacterium RIFCSPHIGHO2_02_FULL_40_15]